MILPTVLQYLLSDDELKNMLGHSSQHAKITAYKPFDKNAYPYVVVNLTPFDMGKVTNQYRAEVRIVTNKDEEVEKLTTKIDQLLHFGNKLGFKKNNETLFHSTFGGSGFLFDEEKSVFEQVLFYNLTFKRKG